MQASTAPVLIVGGGIAGVTCAKTLAEAGAPVRLIDQGHRLGGRMAVRRWEERPVDLGASYFTVDDPGFADLVAEWTGAGLARGWTDRFTVLDAAEGDEPRVTQGPMRYGALTGLRSLVEDLASGLDVTRRTVESVQRADSGWSVDGDTASAVVLSMPDAQAARLVDDRRQKPDRAYEPVLALVAWFADRTWDAVSPDGPFQGAFVNGHDTLSWIADDGRRRGDDAPVLVAHSTPEFAAEHLDDPAAAEPDLVAALRDVLDLPQPERAFVKRWSLARPTGERRERFRLDADLLGWCGDGWGHPSRVETAYLSGRALGEALLAALR